MEGPPGVVTRQRTSGRNSDNVVRTEASVDLAAFGGMEVAPGLNEIMYGGGAEVDIEY